MDSQNKNDIWSLITGSNIEVGENPYWSWALIESSPLDFSVGLYDTVWKREASNSLSPERSCYEKHTIGRRLNSRHTQIFSVTPSSSPLFLSLFFFFFIFCFFFSLKMERSPKQLSRILHFLFWIQSSKMRFYKYLPIKCKILKGSQNLEYILWSDIVKTYMPNFRALFYFWLCNVYRLTFKDVDLHFHM